MMKIEEKVKYGMFDKVTKYSDGEFTCVVYEEPCTKFSFVVKTPDIFLYPEVNIVYNFRTDKIDVYWILDRLKTGILDEKIDAILDNFKKERRFVYEVLKDVKQKREV